MQYILFVSDKKLKKEYRFFNPLSEDEVKQSFIPQNCRLIKEGEMPFEDILKIPLINDGISPISFDTSDAFIEFYPDKRDSHMIIAVMLLVTGYCQKHIGKEEFGPKSQALQERFELLHEASESHQKLLSSFLDKEKTRKNPFYIPEEMKDDLKNMNLSKNKLLEVVKDIEIILGGKTKSILSEFKNLD